MNGKDAKLGGKYISFKSQKIIKSPMEICHSLILAQKILNRAIFAVFFFEKTASLKFLPGLADTHWSKVYFYNGLGGKRNG
jgi:hypothetical protein